MQCGRRGRLLLTKQWFLLQHSEHPYTAWRTMPLAGTTRSPREYLYSPDHVTCVMLVFSTLNCKLWWYKLGLDSKVMQATTVNPKQNARKQVLHLFEKLVKNCTRMYSPWMALLTNSMNSLIFYFGLCICASYSCRPSLHSKEPSLQLIDMGRGIDMTLFPEGTTFNTVVTTKDFQCIEMQTKQPWTYQVTIFC